MHPGSKYNSHLIYWPLPSVGSVFKRRKKLPVMYPIEMNTFDNFGVALYIVCELYSVTKSNKE